MQREIMVLQLLEDGKPRRRDEIAYSLGEASQVLNRMTASELLMFDRTTQQYSITKLGAEELEYSRAERAGIMMDSKGVMIEA